MSSIVPRKSSESCQKVLRKTSESHQKVPRKSSESPHKVLKEPLTGAELEYIDGSCPVFPPSPHKACMRVGFDDTEIHEQLY